MKDKIILQNEYIPLFGIWKFLEVGSYPSKSGICGPEGELDTCLLIALVLNLNYHKEYTFQG